MSGSTIERAAMTDLVRDLTATSGHTARVLAPFTGELLHELPLSSEQDVEDAAAAARVAQAAWWAAGDAHRRRVLLKAHDLMLERREELLDVVQLETGKTRGQAFEEVFNSANSTRYNALSARRVLNLPTEVTPCCVVPLGWPRGRYGPTTRRPVDEVVHLDRYGNRAWFGPSRTNSR